MFVVIIITILNRQIAQCLRIKSKHYILDWLILIFKQVIHKYLSKYIYKESNNINLIIEK